jgi:hypothetical protein
MLGFTISAAVDGVTDDVEDIDNEVRNEDVISHNQIWCALSTHHSLHLTSIDHKLMRCKGVGRGASLCTTAVQAKQPLVLVTQKRDKKITSMTDVAREQNLDALGPRVILNGVGSQRYQGRARRGNLTSHAAVDLSVELLADCVYLLTMCHQALRIDGLVALEHVALNPSYSLLHQKTFLLQSVSGGTNFELCALRWCALTCENIEFTVDVNRS